MTETIYAPANWNKQLRKPTEAGLPRIGLSERAVLSEILQRCKSDPRGFFEDSARGIAYALEANAAVVGKAIQNLKRLGLILVKKLGRAVGECSGVLAKKSPLCKSQFHCLAGAAYTHSYIGPQKGKVMKKGREKKAAAQRPLKALDFQPTLGPGEDLNTLLDLAASERRPTKSAQQPRQIQSLQKKSRMSASTPKRETSPTPSKQLRKQEQQCPKVYRRPRPCVNSTNKAPSTTKAAKPLRKPFSGDLKKKSARVIRQGQDSSAGSKPISKTQRKFVPSSSERPSFSDENDKRKWEAKRRWHGRQQAQKIKDGDAYYTTSTPLMGVNVWAALGLQNTADDSPRSNTQAHRSSRTQRRNGERHTTNTSPTENPSASLSGSPRWGESSRGKLATPRTSRATDGVSTKSRRSSETLSTDSRAGSSSTETPTGTTRRCGKSPATGSSRWLIKPSENERSIDHDNR